MESRLWFFSADMNADGAVTYLDAWPWLKWLFFYPGDFLMNIAMNLNLQDVLYTLEPAGHLYGGLLSGLLSLFFWFFVIRLVD